MSQKTVTINGTLYDAHTGLPLGGAPATQPRPVSFRKSASAKTIHTSAQKSKTLNRTAVKKSSHLHMDGMTTKRPITKSPHITKFAKHPAGVHATKIHSRVSSDIAPVKHPLQHKVAHHQVKAAVKPVAIPKPSHIIKHEAITKAMEQTNKKTLDHKKAKPSSRRLRFASASLALLLLAGYFTYINMPNLSVRVASSQAGIAASYPEYRPDGYSLNGAVAYTQGSVSMKFASNSGSSDYTLKQTKSSWDSSALLDNYVRQHDGNVPSTHTERGLTIYIDGANATWVNRGILYSIEGNAPLSTDQIRRIATSL